MEQRELRARDGDAHVRARRVQRLDQMPGDDAARQLASGEAYDALGDGLGTDAPQQTSKSHIGPHQAELSIHF